MLLRLPRDLFPLNHDFKLGLLRPLEELPTELAPFREAGGFHDPAVLLGGAKTIKGALLLPPP